MSFFKKDHPRLTVKFINPENNTLLFEINDRDQLNVGELFVDSYVTELLRQECDLKKINEVTVLVVANYKKIV